MNKTGVLLVNLGTPDSPEPSDVKSYLQEFLTDKRVIDSSFLARQFLVRCVIVPRRYQESAAFYKKIWTPEGSPLFVHGKNVEKKLSELMGDKYKIVLGMRYKNPSLFSGLEQLRDCKQIIVLPLFPQYASATTGSVHEKVMEIVSRQTIIPEFSFVGNYPTQPSMIDAFCSLIQEHPLEYYDKLIFSFHGLPKKQIIKSDRHRCCLKTPDCCTKICNQNKNCYSAQCFATARAIINKLNLPENKYKICFQSRLGKDPWLKPYTTDVLLEAARQGDKKLLVVCPSFVCDCIETIHEIGIEYRDEFLKAGGEELQLVRGLNDHPLWIKALSELIQERTQT